MSRTFSGSTSHYLEYAGAVVGSGGAEDCTFAAWVYPTSSAALMFALSTAWSLDAQFAGIGMRNSTRAGTIWSSNGGGNNIDSTNVMTLNAWNHVVGTFDQTSGSTVDLTVVLNGDWASRGAAASKAWQVSSSVDRTNIGVNRDNSPGQAWNGNVAHPAIWKTVLGQGEIEALAAGVSPLLIRTDVLAAYWPCHGVSTGGEIDFIGRQDMAETGTVGVAESPLVAGAWPSNVTREAGAPPSGFEPAWAARSTVTISGGVTT